MTNTSTVLEVKDVHKTYKPAGSVVGAKAAHVRAVQGVSLTVHRGQTVGIVGESGCGKSTLANAILMLEPPDTGEIVFDGTDMTRLRGGALRRIRRRIQCVFQDPYTALNARMTIGQIIGEPLRVHGLAKGRRAIKAQVGTALSHVGLNPRDARRYPHELSGGQRQRAGIARALVVDPQLVVLDEPTSALDVSVQAQILNLLLDLQAESERSFVFISHDLAVVSQMAHVAVVMYAGRIVESGPVEEVFSRPRHPYTDVLLDATPGAGRSPRATAAAGETRAALDVGQGCPFVARCPIAQDTCAQVAPELRSVDATGVEVACHFPRSA
ncbi:MAG: ATP-binding cassette domain-containing protein [Propionibacteriales bacterium]|nr:ATP-binding cassette domain-containing protein [Propionibacteriales bacterium]